MRECARYCSLLREEMSRWLAQSVRLDPPGPNRGGEDEANYALAWFDHYLVTGDDDVAAHFRRLLSCLKGWVERECFHGYEPEAEAHHGTEPFLLFLPRYIGLFGTDEVALGLLEDAAHHIGNWIDGIPEWYDYDRDCFRSYHLGTRVVGKDPAYAFEGSDHLRFIHLALAAHAALGDQRCLDWAVRYGRKWAERVLKAGGDRMPVLWKQDGTGLRESDLASDEQRRMASCNHHVPGDPLAGVENLLSSGFVHAMGDLYASTGETVFREAARRIAALLVDQLADPYGDPAAQAVAHYRTAFGDDSLDTDIAQAIASFPPEAEGPIAMVLPQQTKRREPGVGKRKDMVYWGVWSEHGSVLPTREPSTAALALAYQLTGEIGCATRAFKSAWQKLSTARRVLRGGREHSDMGGAVCSVAAGHGRNWGCGALTGCYGPLVLGTQHRCGSLAPSVQFGDETGACPLPEGVLCLVRPFVGAAGDIILWNNTDAEVQLTWRPNGKADDDWRQDFLPPVSQSKHPLTSR